MNIYEELKWRGLIQDISSPELIDKLNNGGLTFYIGTDPTADSMHIGHYSSFLISRRLKNAGHNPILLVGGATGLIGDPKPDAERPMISKEEVEHNFIGLKNQAEKIFGFEVVNNYDWTKDINVVDFLRDYGKYFNINYMLAKDKVKSRLESGITYAEFSYMILQALDFLYLFENRNCVLQVAGSDQWGNITSGIELIRKKTGKEAYGMVMPLVVDSTGKKFGKTEGNALWLDKNKTSSYEMYQYLVNLEDSMIVDYLKKLTFLSKEEIEALEKSNNEHPEYREAHKALAREIITDLHGSEEFEKAVKISECLFSGDIKELDVNDILVGFKDVPHFEIGEGVNVVDMLVNNGIASSKREAREFINSGAVSINGDKITDEGIAITKEMALDGKVLVIKKRKEEKLYWNDEVGDNMSILGKLKDVNYKRMTDLMSYIAKENNKKKIEVYFDFFVNAATRGIGYVDYLKGNYINLTKEQKEDYLNKKNYVKLVKYLNKRGYTMVFHDKVVFNRIFKDYIGREFIDIREVGFKGFKKFVEGKDNVFAKKHNSFGGDGVERIIINNDLKSIYNRLYDNKQYLIEDTLIQHDYLNKINPAAVNNVRIVTLLKDGKVHVLFKTLRINAGSEEVISCHDIYMTLADDGTILGNVVDDECNIYDKHPESGFKFEGAKIPHMDKAIKLVKEAAKLVPEMRYVGWDVAITKKGAAIIEGNNYPSFGLHQFYLLEDGEEIGKYKKIKEILKDEI